MLQILFLGEYKKLFSFFIKCARISGSGEYKKILDFFKVR